MQRGLKSSCNCRQAQPIQHFVQQTNPPINNPFMFDIIPDLGSCTGNRQHLWLLQAKKFQIQNGLALQT
eukprot:11571938-Karenia_brevis.AAC.1